MTPNFSSKSFEQLAQLEDGHVGDGVEDLFFGGHAQFSCSWRRPRRRPRASSVARVGSVLRALSASVGLGVGAVSASGCSALRLVGGLGRGLGGRCTPGRRPASMRACEPVGEVARQGLEQAGELLHRCGHERRRTGRAAPRGERRRPGPWHRPAVRMLVAEHAALDHQVRVALGEVAERLGHGDGVAGAVGRERTRWPSGR